MKNIKNGWYWVNYPIGTQDKTEWMFVKVSYDFVHTMGTVRDLISLGWKFFGPVLEPLFCDDDHNCVYIDGDHLTLLRLETD